MRCAPTHEAHSASAKRESHKAEGKIIIRLALIGCGAHAETGHADPLRRYAAQNPNELQLIACCDLRRERAEMFCQRYGFETAYADPQEMLNAERPAAVVCAVPIELTLSLGSELLRRGIPCVLEKPPGSTLAEVAALVAVARETQTPHLISVNRRFSPFLNHAIEWAKEAGPIRYVHARMLRHNRREEDFIWGTGVHLIDALRHIGGEWHGFEVRGLKPPLTAAPWFLISFRFASGCEGRAEIMPIVGMIEETYDLYGDNFRASATTVGGMGEIARFWRGGKLEREERADPTAPLCRRDGSYEETEAFLNALRSGTTPRPDVADVARTMEICANLQAALGAKERL